MAQSDLTDRQLGELAAVDSVPVHVLDQQTLRVRYQNHASRVLFGDLENFAAFEALQNKALDTTRPRLQNVYRLTTRQGPRSFLLDARNRGDRVVHVLKEISSLESSLDDVYRGENVDPLTKALTRRAFAYALAREMSRAERYGQGFQLLIMDLDGRDHIAGEYAPASIAYVDATIGGLVRSTIRETDIFGQFDDDLLALALPATDREGGIWVAERIRRLIETLALTIDGRSVRVTVCIGITPFRRQDMLQHLLQRARDALVRAKAKGPNTLVSTDP
jgi:diguanylate cyclase (GGDEF)-like protein